MVIVVGFRGVVLVVWCHETIFFISHAISSNQDNYDVEERRTVQDLTHLLLISHYHHHDHLCGSKGLNPPPIPTNTQAMHIMYVFLLVQEYFRFPSQKKSFVYLLLFFV